MTQLHDKRYPGESEAYRDARNRLLQAEEDLRSQVEKVAELRRRLPQGGKLKEDYVFHEMDRNSGEVREVAFSELFAPGKDSLIIYNFMFGPDWEKPCPMCTSILDGYDGNAAYVQDRVNLAVVAKAPAPRLAKYAEGRGWRRLRLLSSHNNSFNADYHAEFPSSYGDQHPLLQVFVRKDGIYHFWSSELLYCPRDGGDPRHIDMTWPLWNLFDITPEGRGTDWYPNYQK